MARKNKPGPGRPHKKIDLEKLKELALIQCTNQEIAASLKIDVDTLHDNYSDLLQKYREEGHCSLRRAQWKKAMEGNPAMLIWCGKFFLGQKEEINFTGTKTDVKTLLENWEITAKKKGFHQKIREKKEQEEQGIDAIEQFAQSKNEAQTT